jgi:general secretion pathway protein H
MMRSADNGAGFTLLEVLIVLGIVALAVAALAPLAGLGRGAADLGGTVADLSAQLRAARSAAIRSNREAEIVLDVTGRRYWGTGAAAPRALPPRIAWSLTSDSGEQAGGTGRIRFFPDGSSTGGSIGLRDGGANARIAVDWLTGAINVTRGAR